MNNGIAKITLQGKPVFLKFGLPALRQVGEKSALYKLTYGPEENLRYNDLGFAHVLYAGYVNECCRNDKLPEIPFSDFYDYVDGSDEDTVTEIQLAITAWDNSKAVEDFTKSQKKNLTENNENP